MVIESEENFGASGAKRTWDADRDSRERVTGWYEEEDRASLGTEDQEA